MILIASKEEKAFIDSLRKLGGMDKVSPLTDEVVALKKQIVTLEIEKSKKTESHEREERELRHMIGLEKKRQEFEIKQAKDETSLTVRQENLAADKLRFEGQMKFQQDRFEKEVAYLKEMMADILARLPNVNMAISKKGR